MNYYKNLPQDYHPIYSIDATDTKTGIILNAIAIVLMAGTMAIIWLLKGFTIAMFSTDVLYSILAAIALLLYLVVHELVHGLFYKIVTGGEKLTFGISWSCAFCGMPDLYMKRNPMIVTAMAPFVIFSILMGAGIWILPAGPLNLYLTLIFAIHFGGCVGDLYISWLMAFRYPNDILINDTGAKQTFYGK